MLLTRPVRLFIAALLVSALTGGAVVAQLESGDRGILPLDSSNTLEIGGIKVDTAGKDAAEARFNGWRQAQRLGFKALWAKTNRRPISEAPNLPDSTLDGLVSSIIVEREQIAPGRYVASLGVLFDRARSGALLGVAGQVRRSAPLLLIPVMVSGGTMTAVETRNPWQRAWAEFRTSQSPVDYVRVSGLGADPLLINAAQTARPGRDWWRNIIDLYGAADVLTAEVRLKRLYPGGPASGTFIGYIGPDKKPLGTFTLRATNSAGMPQMMAEGVQQMDALFTRYLAAGQLVPDPSLIVPEPPPPPAEEEVTEKPQATGPVFRPIQVVVTSPYSPVGWLRSIPGVTGVREIGSTVLVVNYRGTPGQLQAALAARGWQSDTATGVFRITGYAPPRPQPAPPPPAPTPPAPQPTPALTPPGTAD
ncbi:heavy-metal-associated domain-containing protein [uncultured Sphingomonas sp.]|uniref:heavy-metal-associated domain-containing protein n=1 Tax=uncultured Sphingomonas sp. TaxID=158754 RepID=UPI0025E04637|nr:heavy-metal-associated domain-containing protein [uncultured Sphingomonas sp.]